MNKKQPLHNLVLVVSLGTMLVAAVPALAVDVLYGIGFAGADGPATLYTINRATGAGTVVGAVGFERCGGMDFNNAGVLYATCERNDGSNIPVLVRVNTATGAGTEVGPTGLNGAIGDVSFRADGTLFAYIASNTPTHMLATINPATGVGTIVGDTGLSFGPGNGMSFDLSGTLFHSQRTLGPSPNLNTLNPATGAVTFVSQIPPVTAHFNAMDADPDSGTMYAVLNQGSSGLGPTSLATIDTVAHTSAVIGLTVPSLDAIAFGPAATQAPALGTFGLALLGALLALVAVLAMRRM